MSISIIASTFLKDIPDDLITAGEAAKIAGGASNLTYARRFNPNEFPKNYGGKAHMQRFSLSEVEEFFLIKYPAAKGKRG